MFFEENPYLIQEQEDDCEAIPLVLIHDGGGTTFAYHCLDELERPVYGLWSPHFEDGESYKGGIPEMAEVYTGMVRKEIGDRPVLLGGWSMGGMIALEMAHQARKSQAIDVAGVIMIDSPYTKVAPERRFRDVDTSLMQVSSSDTYQKIMKAFAHSRTAMDSWNPPKWDPDFFNPSPDSVDETSGISPPPQIFLLRTSDTVPVVTTESATEEVALIDAYRSKPLLGWENNACENSDKSMITQVLPIDGCHFSIFMAENIDSVSSQLFRACNLLDHPLTLSGNSSTTDLTNLSSNSSDVSDDGYQSEFFD